VASEDETETETELTGKDKKYKRYTHAEYEKAIIRI
jgi:hypothetical protein